MNRCHPPKPFCPWGYSNRKQLKAPALLWVQSSFGRILLKFRKFLSIWFQAVSCSSDYTQFFLVTFLRFAIFYYILTPWLFLTLTLSLASADTLPTSGCSESSTPFFTWKHLFHAPKFIRILTVSLMATPLLWPFMWDWDL